MSEYLLDPKNERLTIFPIKELKVWDFYKTMLAAIWTAEEIDFSKDYDDFQKLNKDEQHFIKMILAFFAASDRIVNINLGERFTQEVKIMEIIVAYQFQIMMENIHSETYSFND
jgi:ribonucleotide reductase beta subunit family protein with ferritin-like domain